MKKIANLSLFSLMLLVVLCSLQCEDDPIPLNNTAEFVINDWEIGQIDNSGASPKVITGQDIAPLKAYGIRLTALCEVFFNPEFDMTNDYAFYTNRNYITDLSISTVNTLSPAHPAGSDVTELFRFWSNSVSGPRYYQSNQANIVLNYPYITDRSSSFHTDLLLVAPDGAYAGEHQFNIQINVQDTLLTTLTSPKINLQ